MSLTRVASYEYKNDYLYIIIRQAPEYGPKAHLLCCGIDIRRFDPLCRGTHGICSNPAFKGLQLLRADIAAIALRKGASSRPVHYGDCMLVSPGEKAGTANACSWTTLRRRSPGRSSNSASRTC